MPRDRTIPRNRKATTLEDSANMVTGFFKLQAVYDAQEEARGTLEEVTERPICISGCGKCCEGMTPVSTRLEAMYALASMSLLPSYTDVKARAERWMADGASALNVVGQEQHGRFIVGNQSDPLAMDFEKLKHSPCPFLADDKSCSIYEFRPLQCRTYGVTSTAEPDCPRPLHYTESDSKRMYVERGTPLGERIRMLTASVVGWVKAKKPDMAQVGFFPALIVQEMTSKKEIAEMPIMPAKWAMRDAKEIK